MIALNIAPNNALVLSLSIASIPLKPSCCSLITGIPPPPAAITSVSFFNKCFNTSNSIIEMGCGEGTTRLYPLPASSTNINPFSFEFVQLLLCCKITIGFEGLLNAGSFSSTSTCVTSYHLFIHWQNAIHFVSFLVIDSRCKA